MASRQPRIQVCKTGYFVGRKKFNTVLALEAELVRRKVRNAHLVVGEDRPSFRKVAAALRVCLRHNALMHFGFAFVSTDDPPSMQPNPSFERTR
jgi:hypothetical protein